MRIQRIQEIKSFMNKRKFPLCTIVYPSSAKVQSFPHENNSSTLFDQWIFFRSFCFSLLQQQRRHHPQRPPAPIPPPYTLTLRTFSPFIPFSARFFSSFRFLCIFHCFWESEKHNQIDRPPITFEMKFLFMPFFRPIHIVRRRQFDPWHTSSGAGVGKKREIVERKFSHQNNRAWGLIWYESGKTIANWLLTTLR